MSNSGNDFLVEVVDFVMPLLPPYETSLYLYLLRHSHMMGSTTIRIGKRTIAVGIGRGTRSSQANYHHVTEKLNNLAIAGFINIGDTDRTGTLYTVHTPSDVPAVREAMAAASLAVESTENYFRDSDLRDKLFERDHWRCRYCAETVTAGTASLDHIVPVSRGGPDTPANLATCCLMCNSIKAGRTYEEAAAQILAAVRTRRAADEG